MEPQPVRVGRTRDRRGRGVRGPLHLPGPFAPDGIPVATTAARRFDDLTLALVDRVRERVGSDLDAVEFGVEDSPLVPEDWADDPLPLATVVPAQSNASARIVVFRLPVQHRATGRTETTDLVLDLLVQRVAELLGRAIEDVDPR